MRIISHGLFKEPVPELATCIHCGARFELDAGDRGVWFQAVSAGLYRIRCPDCSKEFSAAAPRIPRRLGGAVKARATRDVSPASRVDRA
jgi:DNA-directed RNA polymerase subunit RPC12/RpoP